MTHVGAVVPLPVQDSRRHHSGQVQDGFQRRQTAVSAADRVCKAAQITIATSWAGLLRSGGIVHLMAAFATSLVVREQSAATLQPPIKLHGDTTCKWVIYPGGAIGGEGCPVV